MFHILIPVAVLLLIALWVMSTYNQLVRLKLMAQEAWSGIDVQLKRRYDLIPNLVEIVKGYSFHEKNILTDVTRLRTQSMQATTIKDKQVAETELAGTLKILFAFAENYPDLKANENYLALQKELSFIEQELQLSRRYYNGSVRNYVISIEQFPSNIIAKLFGFSGMSYFEITTDQERSAPNIKF
ncbi:MAG: hypothetical protein CL947_01470 [Epsilonproteobacteria bacterium]|nr:hypothetical protein [Campylobacterota bacterium]